MAVALLSAQRSKDPSTQVGACIVDHAPAHRRRRVRRLPGRLLRRRAPLGQRGRPARDQVPVRLPRRAERDPQPQQQRPRRLHHLHHAVPVQRVRQGDHPVGHHRGGVPLGQVPRLRRRRGGEDPVPPGRSRHAQVRRAALGPAPGRPRRGMSCRTVSPCACRLGPERPCSLTSGPDATSWPRDRSRTAGGAEAALTRDLRFVAAHRGGPLDLTSHRLLAAWAAECAEHVQPLFDAACPGDDRPRLAVEAARAWSRGEIAAGRRTRGGRGGARGGAGGARGRAARGRPRGRSRGGDRPHGRPLAGGGALRRQSRGAGGAAARRGSGRRWGGAVADRAAAGGGPRARGLGAGAAAGVPMSRLCPRQTRPRRRRRRAR